MDVFEIVLVMLIATCLLQQLSRRLALPYPSKSRWTAPR